VWNDLPVEITREQLKAKLLVVAIRVAIIDTGKKTGLVAYDFGIILDKKKIGTHPRVNFGKEEVGIVKNGIMSKLFVNYKKL
jgi:hypothetical protein